MIWQWILHPSFYLSNLTIYLSRVTLIRQLESAFYSEMVYICAICNKISMRRDIALMKSTSLCCILWFGLWPKVTLKTNVTNMYSHVPKERPRTFIWHLKKFSYSFPYFYQKFHCTLFPTHTFLKLLASFSWGSVFTL